MWESLKSVFTKYFLAGLLVLVPISVSLWIIVWIVTATDELVATNQWLPFPIPGLGLLITVVVILLAGFVGKNVVGRYLFSSAGSIVNHIPVIGTIYTSASQMMETMLGGSPKKFGRVVLIEFPHPGCQTIAFVTSENIPEEAADHLSEPHVSVFLPTTPSPVNGFYLLIPKSKVKNLDLKVDDAFKLIVSLGLVAPKHDGPKYV